MATMRISEADAIRDIALLLIRAHQGEEIVIEKDGAPAFVVRKASPPSRTIEQCIALLPADSPATIDEDFASDVLGAIAAHRESLNPGIWD